MSILNPDNPMFQLVVVALIGILAGSASVTALAYNNVLPGLVVQTGETTEKLDTLDNRTQDIVKSIEEIKNEINRIEKKLDENTINVDGDYIKYLKEILAAINNEVQMIEKKLDMNGIDVNGTFASQVLSQLKNISTTLSNLNVTVINNNINNVTNQVNNINNVVNNVYNIVSQTNNYVQNIYNFTENNYFILNEISITVNEIYNFIFNEIYQQIYMINITVNQLNVYIQDIYLIVIYIRQTADAIYNILVNIQVSIQQIIDTLIVINFKTQKEVIIGIEHVSDVPDPLVKELYVMVSLEGEGGLNTTSISVYVLNVPDAIIFIEETSVPGLYRVVVFMPDTTPPGSYLLVVEGDIVLPLPDGSQEVFRGRKMTSIYVW